MQKMQTLFGRRIGLVIIAGTLLAGCARQEDVRVQMWEEAGVKPLEVRPLSYDLQVALNPGEHELEGSATICVATPRGQLGRGRFGLGLRLHEGLQLDDVRGRGVVNWQGPVVAEKRRHYIVTLDRLSPVIELQCRYHGQLVEDIQAGEVEGEIHNFSVQAHVGPEGVYLAEEADWYPHVYVVREELPSLAAYQLQVTKRENLELVAGCDRVESNEQFWRWQSQRNLAGLALAGGPLQRNSRLVGKVTVETLLHPDHADFSIGLLDAVQDYLEIYEPLLGPYPYRHFTVVENFFSSGFAYPTFTLMGSAVIQMGERGLRPGYLDHEMVHNWWGNGVNVDPRDGNWCEALTSYCTNYYRYLADQDPDGARKHRRDIVNRLSQMNREYDQPLGSFGQPEGTSRLVGYQKGEMVFHQLSTLIGQELFWAGLREFRRQHFGRFANWADLQQAFEKVSGRDLDLFFQQWVRGRGLPRVELQSASYDSSNQQLQLVMIRDGLFMELTVPVRVWYGEGPQADFEDFPLPMEEPMRTFELLLDQPPQRVQLDPDFQMLRQLPPDQIMPTLSSLNHGPLLIVTPAGELAEGYADVAEQMTREGVRQITVEQLQAADLNSGHLLLLGDAVRHSDMQQLLEAAGLAVDWDDTGFKVGEQNYTDANAALLVTIHHRHKPGAMITIYYGNSADALSNAGLIGFYPNSLLVFESGRPTFRQDFERIPFLEVARP
ncbi:MAG: hypothetical protein HJJLKODD_01105 [Phycisphaerae bacterium]|nr:hypothetical protein [Phycisphaerae bacterium]